MFRNGHVAINISPVCGDDLITSFRELIEGLLGQRAFKRKY
jgi:hypothetical protein